MSLSSTSTLKAQLTNALGSEAPAYFKVLKEFLSGHISRTEFEEVLKKLNVLSREGGFDILGHSWGGMLAAVSAQIMTIDSEVTHPTPSPKYRITLQPDPLRNR